MENRNFIYNTTLVVITVLSLTWFALSVIYDGKNNAKNEDSKTCISVGNWNWMVYTDAKEGGNSTIKMEVIDSEDHVTISGHIDDPVREFLSFNNKQNNGKEPTLYNYAVAEVMPNNAALETLINLSPDSFSFWVKGDGLTYKIVVRTAGDLGNDNYYWISRVFPKTVEKIIIPYNELTHGKALIDQSAIKSIAIYATTEFIKDIEDGIEGSDFAFTIWWDSTMNDSYALTAAENNFISISGIEYEID